MSTIQNWREANIDNKRLVYRSLNFEDRLSAISEMTGSSKNKRSMRSGMAKTLIRTKSDFLKIMDLVDGNYAILDIELDMQTRELTEYSFAIVVDSEVEFYYHDTSSMTKYELVQNLVTDVDPDFLTFCKDPSLEFKFLSENGSSVDFVSFDGKVCRGLCDVSELYPKSESKSRFVAVKGKSLDDIKTLYNTVNGL